MADFGSDARSGLVSRKILGTARMGLALGVAWLSLAACSSDGAAGGSGGAGASNLSGASGSAGAAGALNGGGAASGAGGASGSAGLGGATGGTAGAAAIGGGAGTAGATGGAGTGGSMGMPGAVPSMGCGKMPGQPLATYVKHSEMITGVSDKQAPRNYFLWLPDGYNPDRAYPLVFIGPGCGSDGMHGIQIQSASGKDAIVVGLDPSTNVDPQGRQCFDTQTFPDPEVPYFDQTLAAIEADYCVDKSRLFVEGFSSGSWLSNLLGCVDAGVIRAQGNSSGCMQGLPADACKGPIAYFGVHNDPDPNNSYGCGTQNRDEKIKRNGCTTQTMPFTPTGLTVPAGATVDCVQYVGCKPGYPVVFCTTKNVNPNHNPADDATTHLTTAAMWDFWTKLPQL